MLFKTEGYNLPAATPFKPRESKLQVRYTYPQTQDRSADPIERFYRPGFRIASAPTRWQEAGYVKIHIRSHSCSLLRSGTRKPRRSWVPLAQEATNNQTRRIEGRLWEQKR